MTRIQTRLARASDAAAISGLVEELGYPANAQDIGWRLEKLLADPKQRVTLAVRDETAVGFIAAEHRLILESGEFIEIVGLAVTAHARTLGIGGQLLAAAESWARERGVPSIRVRSNTTRTGSHPFYESHGYAKTKSQHVYAKHLDA